MASLLRKLQEPLQSHRSASLTAPAPSPTALHLIEVIAFGEVYAVPVTRATPATVVVRYVMEAAVPAEQAAMLGNTEVTLYYKEKPLPLDTLMGKLPRRVVLHLHASLAATAAIVRSRELGAVSMLPLDRQRSSLTTVTVQPVLKDGGSRSREGSGSTTGGLSSEGRGGSPLDPFSVAPSATFEPVFGSSASHAGGAPMVMLSPMMVPMVPTAVSAAGSAGSVYGTQPGVAPVYYSMPAQAAAAAGVRLLGPQGRTMSTPCLSAGRRRDSAVGFANSCLVPHSDAFLTPAAATRSVSPLVHRAESCDAPPRPASPPPAHSEACVVLYLRLPRDGAAAGMAAAALCADRAIEAEEVQPDEVPHDELLNATFSTVATNASQLPRAYAYRRLRVPRSFPVGTLRDLCAASPRHRLHVAHTEISDEAKTFAELKVANNAVFYFKAAQQQSGKNRSNSSSPDAKKAKKTRPLTRERLQEHIEAGGAARESEGRELDASLAPSPSRIEGVHPSLDRSAESPERRSPALPADVRRPVSSSGSVASSTSSQSIRERIHIFNEEAVRNGGGGSGDDEGADSPRSPSAGRYVVEGRELTITSALAAEQARRAAELAARQAEADREAAVQYETSPPTDRRAAAMPLEREEDVDVDVATQDGDGEAPTPIAAASTARGPDYSGHQDSPDPQPHAPPASNATPANPFATAAQRGRAPLADPEQKDTKKKAKGGAFGWLRRTASATSSDTPPQQQQQQPLSGSSSRTSSLSSQQRGPHPARTQRIAKVHSGRLSRSLAESADSAAVVPLTAEAGPKPAAHRLGKAAKVRRAASTGEAAGGAVVALSATEESRTASAASSHSSGAATSLKASLQRLRKQKAKTGTTMTEAASPSASEPRLGALSRRAERLSHESAPAAAATEAAEAAALPGREEVEGQRAGPADREGTNSAETEAAKEKEERRARKGSAATPSYSKRKRQSTDAVPPQPVAFLGATPSHASPSSSPHPPKPTPSALNAAPSAEEEEAEEVSATLGPAALSTTRVPTPRNSPSPVSILVANGPEQQRRRLSNSSSPSNGPSRMTETNVGKQRRSAASPESRPATPDYSVESTGSLNRLRITIKDPEEASRFHYGVPVEPECPVGALREWITAMQRPSSETGKTPPSLRNVDRYGVFAGDVFLADETVTFGEVTGGRNDVIFSIRNRI